MERRPTLLERWPTGVVLLLLLTAALLPLGLVLAWAAQQSVSEARQANFTRAQQQGVVASEAIESLLARNVLALRIAANAALAFSRDKPCEAAARSLAVAPAVAQRFRIRNENGAIICTTGSIQGERDNLIVAPGAVRIWVSPRNLIYYRVGVIGGMATGVLTVPELRQAADEPASGVYRLSISDGSRDLLVIDRPLGDDLRRLSVERHISTGQLRISAVMLVEMTTPIDVAYLLLPLVMWVVAALFSWLLVRRLLLLPLARLKNAVSEYQPGEKGLELPKKFGAATEVRDVSLAFVRAVDRIEGAERAALEAFEGQRRLVREVHHRVKNNLQVVASLLSIHGRSAEQPEAKAAYSAIGRRVDALSVVHRHHYAELEEHRGLSLRPLLTELTADLRSSAPAEARKLRIDLELDAPSTTQDVAVAAAFLITEIVEYTMLRKPNDNIEISLRREDELTATLAVTSAALDPKGDASDMARVQFERIVEGLARQLRSPLDRKLGRYAVTVPIFPER
ncbi:MAG TPA: sensor histidine kinase [Sphingomicrobium sp.]|nr:sensor histidine kinase [Sphingomicrobium sp.]